jgi:menaquinone-dependent protoporphyrinogen oxidase
MTVLVAAASEHGATAEIAAWIGAGLAANGVDVDVRRVDAVDDVARYDAFVLGSAVYLGQWLKTARRFVDDHAGDLAGRPTWLFSSGPIVGDPPPPDDPAAMRAGLVRCAHATEGDHRDRAAVDEWAAEIARELKQLAPSSRRIAHPDRVLMTQ